MGQVFPQIPDTGKQRPRIDVRHDQFKLARFEELNQKLDLVWDPEVTAYIEGLGSRLAAIPVPPPSQDKPLSKALASVDPAQPKSEQKTRELLLLQGIRSKTRSLTIPGDSVWLDTGIELSGGCAVDIIASGRIYYKKGTDLSCDPDSAPDTSGGFFKPLPEKNTGMLIARIGSSSTQYHQIGSRQTLRPGISGRLFLGINDDSNFDNRASFDVKITVLR